MKSVLVILGTTFLASAFTLAQTSVDGFEELMDMASLPAATAGMCARSALERDISSVDAEWENSASLGCKGIEASIIKAKAISDKMHKCNDADMDDRIQKLSAVFSQLRDQKCSGSQDAMSQILGIATTGLQIKSHRDAMREKRQSIARAEHAQLLLDRAPPTENKQTASANQKNHHTAAVVTTSVVPDGYGQPTTVFSEPEPAPPRQDPITSPGLSSQAIECMRRMQNIGRPYFVTHTACDSNNQSHQVQPLPPRTTRPSQIGSSRSPQIRASPQTPQNQPPPEKFGALAIDSNQGSAYGWATNHLSSEAAEQEALSQCRYNGRSCYIVMRFGRATCAAYFADQERNSSAVGWGSANNLAQAQNIATSYCQSRGGRSCVNRAWGCNSP